MLEPFGSYTLHLNRVHVVFGSFQGWVPKRPKVPLLRALWCLSDGIQGFLKDGWRVLVEGPCQPPRGASLLVSMKASRGYQTKIP